jgi:ABC-2 type transport system permease protein
MKNILAKEFKLGIHWINFLFPIVLGALMLIPQWVYFLVPLYFCFISVPNLFGLFKANNDITFSAILPVTRSQIVQGRILTFVILELMHIFWAMVFTLIHNSLFTMKNFMLDQNAAYFGLVFVMFGIFNLILFPAFFRTAYKYGVAVVVAIVGGMLFAGAVEMLVLFSPQANYILEGNQTTPWIILAGGILLFAGANFLSAGLSVKLFNKVNI